MPVIPVSVPEREMSAGRVAAEIELQRDWRQAPGALHDHVRVHLPLDEQDVSAAHGVQAPRHRLQQVEVFLLAELRGNLKLHMPSGVLDGVVEVNELRLLHS